MSAMHPETIPFVDLVGQYRRHKEAIDRAIQTTIENASFIGGPALGRFEEAFARFCGAKHTVGVANGTDALYLILRTLGIGAGDEVIIPVNTFIATAEAVSMTGAKPVLVDVDDRTHLIDPALVERAITPRTKAMIPVHLFGQLAPMAKLSAIAAAHRIEIVEDAAQAHGAEENGQRAGTFGRAAGFSFYPGKNLGAYGDAGAAVTSDQALADKLRKLANHGRAEKFGHDMVGVNSRLDGLQAAILEAKLPHLETWTRERQAAAKRYDDMLRDLPSVRRPEARDPRAHVFHLYVVRVRDRDGLKARFAEKNIQCGIHYPQPLHLLPAYAHLGHDKGAFPVAEKMAGEIISLPMFPEITVEQQHRVVSAIREHVGQGGR
jgi:dTDP-4-amino-4,6-dideoxygalactose transaminase